MIKFGAHATRRIAIIGTYSPRKCGIATFTCDLRTELARQFKDVEFDVVAVNDDISTPAYPDEVRWQVRQNCPVDYTDVAKKLNASGVDEILLQHEFGIYGGDSGEYLMLLLRATAIPVVTTLHTVLIHPTPAQRTIMNELIARSSRLIVMSQRGINILRESYGVDESKLVHIHHGVHDLPSSSNESLRRGLDLQGKRLLLTFGLVSPSKGIENVIAAMPKIVEAVPNAVYWVVGETHPHVKNFAGEAYRESLEKQVADHHLEANVRFVNEYVDLTKLGGLLSLTDVYLTPYLKPEQVTSGTLAYALGCGRAIVSTPYWYAEELLDCDRGVLTPFDDSDAIVGAVTRLLTDDPYRTNVQARALEYGRNMVWKSVAAATMKILSEATATRRVERSLRWPPFAASSAYSFDHLENLTDCTGLLQHATYDVPNYTEGYCVDDNARALLFTAKLGSTHSHEGARIKSLRDRYLAFVRHSFNEDNCRFRNFMSYDRRWLEEAGSEDSHGRVIWALGQLVRELPFEGSSRLASDLLRDSLSPLDDFQSPRSWAYSILGLAGMIQAGENDAEILDQATSLCTRLHAMLESTRRKEWDWFEDVLSYANARLPQALIVGGYWLGRDDWVREGEAALEWLDSVQRSPEGRFEPVGSEHPFVRGGKRPRFAQQPVDVYASISAFVDAANLTGHAGWLERAEQAYDWFFGNNTLGILAFDPETGAGFDGIDADSLNQNRGAESTLSYLLATVEIQAARAKSRPVPLHYAYSR